MRSKWVWALLAAVVGVFVYVGDVLATPATPGLQTTILTKALVDDLDVRASAQTAPDAFWGTLLKIRGLSDVYIVDNKIPPGESTGWHSHPGPSVIFVVAGTVTNYTSDDPQCAPEVYTQGSAFVDQGGRDVHILRNETGSPAETIAVQFLPKDAVRRIDAPAPANCPPF
jgi:quercetin dioxygenase-like cupin family protein